MSFITVTCPFCQGQSQLEAGRSAVCPYCANELNMPADGAFAFAPQELPPVPDPQFAADLQFAPPPAEPLRMQQPDVIPMPQQTQFVTQAPQFHPAVLADAQQKRKNWHLLNTALIGLQTLMFALGILFTVMGLRFGVPLILLWVLTLFGFGAVSGMTRPDAAYIEKKPFWGNRFVQGVTQFWMGAVISGGAGGILFAILAGLLGLY